MRDIFEVKDVPRPFDYPEAIDLMNKISDTYWRHTELPFNADPQEIESLPFHEKQSIIRNLLAISTIECSVKTFWGQLGSHFPRTEWDMLGISAAESENRHFLAYSHIINLLGLDKEFENIQNVPAIKGRFDYLSKYLKLSSNNADRKKYVTKLILFCVLIEHVSLFGQFIPIMYFYRKKGVMKDIRNIVKWTCIDESQHFRIGETIINILRLEHPEIFDEELEEIIRKSCVKSIKYEVAILDWIFEAGELDGLSKENILSYMKHQVNTSLVGCGFKECFEEVGDLKPTEFFYEEVYADSMDDFFAVRPVDYTLGDISITSNDLF